MKIFRALRIPRNKKLSQGKRAILDFLTDVVVIFAVVLLIIKPFFFAPFRVQQDSMLPNILDGEFIVVWKLPHKLGSAYERNDVVVFRPQINDANYLIKRVIGLPGETIRFHQGYVWIRGAEESEFRQLSESFLSARNLGNTCAASSQCTLAEKSKQVEITVPAGSYLVLGDNRLASRDGRTCFLSSCSDEALRFLSKSEIEGRALLAFARFWRSNGQNNISFKNIRLIGRPDEGN
ncbi:MAG: signal peptidase I [Patescibacteria group bacterium]